MLVTKSVSILCHDIWHYSVYRTKKTSTTNHSIRLPDHNLERLLLILLKSFNDRITEILDKKRLIMVRVRATGHFPKKRKTRCIRQINYLWPWITLAAQNLNLAWIEISFSRLRRSQFL